MNVALLQKTAKKVGIAIAKNSPLILTSLGVGGVVTTTVMGATATYKAVRILDEEMDTRYKDWVAESGKPAEEYIETPLTTKEVVKLVWKVYAPTVILGTVTIGCIIASHKISASRYAALAGIYTFTESALKEYQEKVAETFGEKKEQKVQDDIAQDHLNNNPIHEHTIFATGHGDSIFFDDLSGRYFTSTREFLEKSRNDFNKKLLTANMLSVNEWFDEIGLEHIAIGNDIGWDSEHQLLELRFSTKFTTDGRPCGVIKYGLGPRGI